MRRPREKGNLGHAMDYVKRQSSSNYLEGSTVKVSFPDTAIAGNIIRLADAIHVDELGNVIEPKNGFHFYFVDKDGKTVEGLAKTEGELVQVIEFVSAASATELEDQSTALFDFNMIAKIPVLSIGELTSENVSRLRAASGLRKLSISGGNTKLLAGLCLPNLIALHLNKMKRVEASDLKSLGQIQYLSVLNSNEVDLQGVSCLRSLCSLVIRESTIEDIKCIQFLTQLKCLDLNGSTLPITDLDWIKQNLYLSSFVPPS